MNLRQRIAANQRLDCLFDHLPEAFLLDCNFLDSSFWTSSELSNGVCGIITSLVGGWIGLNQSGNWLSILRLRARPIVNDSLGLCTCTFPRYALACGNEVRRRHWTGLCVLGKGMMGWDGWMDGRTVRLPEGDGQGMPLHRAILTWRVNVLQVWEWRPCWGIDIGPKAGFG